MSTLAGIGALIGGVSGLFSKSKGAPSARENTVKLAQGARQASERYGFNPLTMLGAGAGMGGGGGGGAPPLASIQMLTEGLQGIDDVISGDADRRRQADQLQLDLAKVQLEQARSGVIASGQTAADAVGGSLSPLGAPRGTYVQNPARAVPARYSAASSVAKSKGKFSQGENPVAPGRKDDVAPLLTPPASSKSKTIGLAVSRSPSPVRVSRGALTNSLLRRCSVFLKWRGTASKAVTPKKSGNVFSSKWTRSTLKRNKSAISAGKKTVGETSLSRPIHPTIGKVPINGSSIDNPCQVQQDHPQGRVCSHVVGPRWRGRSCGLYPASARR